MGETLYQYFKLMQANCEQMAQKTKDSKLATFYANAAKGFEMKADAIPLFELYRM